MLLLYRSLTRENEEMKALGKSKPGGYICVSLPELCTFSCVHARNESAMSAITTNGIRSQLKTTFGTPEDNCAFGCQNDLKRCMYVGGWGESNTHRLYLLLHCQQQ